MLHVLSEINPHKRDSFILFEEKEHVYTITTDINSKYTSVTQWNHSHFSHFNPDLTIKNMISSSKWIEGHKYWGMKPDEIKSMWAIQGKEASSAGTQMHFEIECFMNNPHLPKGYTHKELLEFYGKEFYGKESKENKSIEWEYFIQFISDHPCLKPFRTEWMIYTEDLKLSGSIDMVYENPDNTLSIYDWKRVKEINYETDFYKFAKTSIISHLPDTNYWHYALQLNTYKYILESKYGKKIKDLYLVCLHPNNQNGTYELIEIPTLTKEILDLVNLRLSQINKQKIHNV